MLKATPIGTEYVEARKCIDLRFPHVFETWDRDGKQPNKVYVTYGRDAFLNVVDVYWYFDPKGRLEKITVSRYLDGP
jgi:hypothetical protein